MSPLYKKTPAKSSMSLKSLSPMSRTSTRTDNTFCIGVIGCGRMGSHLVRKLLQDPSLTPDMILVSTRQPDQLQEFESQGVTCRFDNVWLANNCDVIFICCLPSQLAPVLLDLSKSYVSNVNLLVSLLAGVGVSRIRRAVNNRTNVMRVFFDWNQLSTEDREEMSSQISCVSNRMSSYVLCVASCPFKCIDCSWFAELVLACVAYSLYEGVVAGEIWSLVCGVIADDSVDVKDLLPDIRFDKEVVSKYFDNGGDMSTLTSVIENKELRDVLVEKYWQRAREVEPSLLDIARAQTPNKLI